MKVLAINGSPRKNGNTATLIEKSLEGAAKAGAETLKLDICRLDISPVREEEYYDITEQGLSVRKDDIYAIFEGIKRADAVILGSPIFFGSITAQLKAMIDRFQCAWVSKNIRKKDFFAGRKKGAFICVQASDRKDFFDNAVFIVRHFFATVNADYSEELLCAGLESKDAVSNEPGYLEKAFELGVVLAGGKIDERGK